MNLKRIDEKSAPIPLNFDENSTIFLGRGPLLKISDTKISRNHAQIVKVRDDTFEFSNVKSKPCFYKLQETDQWTQLADSEKVKLENNSFIKLTTESYIFQVDLKVSTKHELSPEPESPPASTSTRSSCPYGSSCIRKNPVHFQDQAHPGDNDFIELSDQNDNENDDENDDRPECEYGTDCYRKNPQHKKDFKHTARPKRKAAKKAQKKAKKAKNDDNDDEYDSSFIDDDESDEQDISDDEESVDEWTPDGKDDD